MLTLADLVGKTEEEIIDHLYNEYSGTVSGFDYGKITETDVRNARKY